MLQVRFNREWLSAIGMLHYAPRRKRQPIRLLFSLKKGTVDSERVMEVVRELRQHVRGKVVLLWDNLGGHISRRTRAFLAERRAWLRVEPFPSYAPELNPVEYLWANLSSGEKAHFAPDTLQALAEEVPRRIAEVARHRALMRSFLKHSGLFPRL